MLEQDEINRILAVINPIEIMEINGKFYNYDEVGKFFDSHGYSKTELDKINKEGNPFDEKDYEDYLNRENSDIEIEGNSYQYGTAYLAIDSSDFEDSYKEYCEEELYLIESGGSDYHYTGKELKRVTGKEPIFAYSFNRRAQDYLLKPSTPVLPVHPSTEIIGE